MEKYIPNTLDASKLNFKGECVSENPSNELYSYRAKIKVGDENFAINHN